MRVGEISGFSTSWAGMNSSSSKAKGLADAVESDAPAKFSESLNPTSNPYTTYRDENPLYELSTKGIRPSVTSMAPSDLLPTNPEPVVAESATPSASETAPEASSAGVDSALPKTPDAGPGVGGVIATVVEKVESAVVGSSSGSSNGGSGS